MSTNERRYYSTYAEYVLYFPEPVEMLDPKTLRLPRYVKFTNHQCVTSDPAEIELIENCEDFRGRKIIWTNKPPEPADVMAEYKAWQERIKSAGLSLPDEPNSAPVVEADADEAGDEPEPPAQPEPVAAAVGQTPAAAVSRKSPARKGGRPRKI